MAPPPPPQLKKTSPIDFFFGKNKNFVIVNLSVSSSQYGRSFFNEPNYSILTPSMKIVIYFKAP